MRPSRVSHSASIGPGVVPRGVDPDYDAEVAKEYEARKHVAHHRKSEKTNFAAKTSGRPFSIDPNAPTTRTQYVKSSSSSSSSLCSFAEKIESSLRRTHFARCCFLSRFYSLSLSLSLSRKQNALSSRRFGCMKEISQCECGAEGGKGQNAEDHAREDDDDE